METENAFDDVQFFRLMVRCHKCDREAEAGEATLTAAGWETLVKVRQDDGSWLQTQLCPRHARWWTLRYWARRYGWRVGRLSAWLSPGYGCCKRCGTSWDYARGHTTWYTDGSGCFPLCERCWGKLTPEARLPFYREMFDSWVANGCTDRDWGAIESAVLREGGEYWSAELPG